MKKLFLFFILTINSYSSSLYGFVGNYMPEPEASYQVWQTYGEHTNESKYFDCNDLKLYIWDSSYSVLSVWDNPTGAGCESVGRQMYKAYTPNIPDNFECSTDSSAQICSIVGDGNLTYLSSYGHGADTSCETDGHTQIEMSNTPTDSNDDYYGCFDFTPAVTPSDTNNTDTGGSGDNNGSTTDTTGGSNNTDLPLVNPNPLPYNIDPTNPNDNYDNGGYTSGNGNSYNVNTDNIIGGVSTTSTVTGTIQSTDSNGNPVTNQTTNQQDNSAIIANTQVIRESSNRNHNDLTTVSMGISNLGAQIDNASNQNHSDLNGVNNVLNQINSNISENNTNMNTALSEISSGVSSASQQNHNDLSNVSTKLDETNQALSSMNDFMQSGVNNTEASDSLTNAQNQATATISSITGSLNGIISSYTGSSPVVTGTGVHVFTTPPIYGKTITFDLSMFENLKQYFDILWLLMLAYFNFKMYVLIIRDLLKKI